MNDNGDHPKFKPGTLVISYGDKDKKNNNYNIGFSLDKYLHQSPYSQFLQIIYTKGNTYIGHGEDIIYWGEEYIIESTNKEDLLKLLYSNDKNSIYFAIDIIENDRNKYKKLNRKISK